jgi:hypothetical protein
MPTFRRQYPKLRLNWLADRKHAAAALRPVSRETPASSADLIAAYGKPRSRTGL